MRDENAGRNGGLQENENFVEASSSFERALTEFRQNLEQDNLKLGGQYKLKPNVTEGFVAKIKNILK